ncbi:hypothetical protein BDA99DRAFT_113131 [Phascolomyces articulosus]|uniref:Uncharacterized protein n=1 Tax=Phascolomyces articulosus TaxID=60185 RepID=A0AAD5KA49_9FUNG|nr:hypothetical protein BDA99DRAFT_113131 [Phascolomyces articulosus]
MFAFIKNAVTSIWQDNTTSESDHIQNEKDTRKHDNGTQKPNKITEKCENENISISMRARSEKLMQLPSSTLNSNEVLLFYCHTNTIHTETYNKYVIFRRHRQSNKRSNVWINTATTTTTTPKKTRISFGRKYQISNEIHEKKVYYSFNFCEL